MKPNFILILSLLFIPMALAAQKNNHTSSLKVVIIRHAEKPASGSNLSCAGLNRSLALPKVLDTLVGIPDYTYIPEINTGKKTSSARMFQTITPYAVQKNLTLNTKYKVSDTTKIAQTILSSKGTVLLVWDHSNIPGLARNLGLATAPEWKGSDYDSIWILEYHKTDANGKWIEPKFIVKKQNLRPSIKCN
jgi:hypothetical protein